MAYSKEEKITLEDVKNGKATIKEYNAYLYWVTSDIKTTKETIKITL